MIGSKRRRPAAMGGQRYIYEIVNTYIYLLYLRCSGQTIRTFCGLCFQFHGLQLHQVHRRFCRVLLFPPSLIKNTWCLSYSSQRKTGQRCLRLNFKAFLLIHCYQEKKYIFKIQPRANFQIRELFDCSLLLLLSWRLQFHCEMYC